MTGPRQAGKTTLVLQVLDGGGTLQRLDDDGLLRAALADPASFAAFGAYPRAIDEVQRAGDRLVRAIKSIVDADRTPGQFLLDGSADFLTVPTISESLAGRAAFFELWPFSQGELGDGADGLVATLLDDPARLRQGPGSRLSLRDYLERVCVGGLPEVVALAPDARRRWFASYVRTITQRDIADVTSVRRASALPRLLRLIAARTAGELVVANLHADSGLGSRDTTESYIGLLEMTFLIRRLPAWSRNLTAKMKRHAKVHITDSGLAAHLLGRDPAGLERPEAPARGPLMETFVVNELRRQIGWLD
ncbi:MAG: ATP-binding protein, partial [Acidimicrobiales bacterium]